MTPSHAPRAAAWLIALQLCFAAAASTVQGEPAIRVDSPAPHAVVTEYQVVVRGSVGVAPGTEFGVTVNGFPALVDGREFATVLPISDSAPPPTALTVIAADANGRSLVRASIPVTVRPAGAAPGVELRPSPDIGTAPLEVTFRAWSEAPVQTATFDARGNGRVDYRGPDLDLQAVTYDRPGVYLPTLTVNGTRRAVGLVRVYRKGELDALHKKKWSGMRAALRRGDVESAVGYFAIEKRASYRTMFNALTIPVADFGRLLGDITFEHLHGWTAEYEMVVATDGQRSSAVVQFTLDNDGIWRLKFI